MDPIEGCTDSYSWLSFCDEVVVTVMCNLPVTNPEKITTTLREYKGGKDYQDFKRECLLYILTNKRAFPSYKKKILFVLSYLKEGTAAV